MSGIENGQSVNNQNAPISAEELAGAPSDQEPITEDAGQGVEADSPEVEEPTKPGEGSKPAKGQPKDYDGLRKEYTQNQQKLAETARQVEFYRSMLQDPEIAPIVKAKLAALERGETFTAAQSAQKLQPAAAGEEVLPDYSQMQPNDVIKDIYNRVYTKVRTEMETTFGERIEPEINRIKAEKAQAIVTDFFRVVPEAQTYRNELAVIMGTRNVNLQDAWKIFDYDNAPSRAKQQFEQDIKLKKDANLLQTGSGTPSVKTSKNPTAGQAIEAVLDRLGVK
uniref:Uncharacterized protein n=1 Tax=viral metagenome TaxID=1070528 RepID=A0A6H1ZBW8_9ZZZZ